MNHLNANLPKNAQEARDLRGRDSPLEEVGPMYSRVTSPTPRALEWLPVGS